MKILKIRRDEATEAVIEEKGCKAVAPMDFNPEELFTWSYKNEPFPLNDIDYEWSKKHLQTRSYIDASGFASLATQPIDPQIVGQYAVEMEHSFKDDSLLKFPAIVIAFIEGRWAIVSGFHRYEAAKQIGFTHFSGVYIVALSRLILTSIPFNFKCNGVRENKDNWIKHQAMLYVKALKEGQNVSIKDWAASCGFREQTFQEAVRAYTMQQKCANKGLPVEKFTTNRHYNLLGKLEKLIGADVFEIAKTAMTYNAKPKDLEDLITDLSGTTTANRVIVLKNFENKIRTGSANGKKPQPSRKISNATKFAEHLSRMVNILKKERGFTQAIAKNVPEPKKSVKLLLDELDKIYKCL